MIKRLITGFKLFFLPELLKLTGSKDYARGLWICLPGIRSIHLLILHK